MKRDEWEFEYTAKVLADASEKKQAVHAKKFDWWEGKKAEVMAKVRSEGIEVHDSVAASYSNTKGGYGPQITIDGGLQRDLTECQTKIQEHNNLVRSYEGWRQVLLANPDQRVKLDHEDWLFFFGE